MAAEQKTLSALMQAAVAVVLLTLPASRPAFAAAVSNCSLISNTCVWSGCRQVQASDGTAVTVCTDGTAGVPPGAVVDTSTSCWRYDRTYQCYAVSASNSCTRARISGCTLVSSTCTKNAPDGACVSYAQTWVCPDRAQTVCQPAPPSANCLITSNVCSKSVQGICLSATQTYQCTGAPATSCTGGQAGCTKIADTCTSWVGSVCAHRTTQYACPGTVTNCVTDPACTKTSASCLDFANGLCADQRQTYTCTSQIQTCVQTKTTNSCTGIATYGFENQTAKPGDNRFAEALKYHALLEAVKKNISGNPPLIFNGKQAQCSNTFGCALGNCCCDIDVGQGGTFVWSCSKEEAQLAASRRAQAAHFLASGCTAGFSFFGACACFQTTRWFCEFPSQLARLVQEQGREQLARMAANGFGGAVQSKIPAFDYYASGAGSWLGPYVDNGNEVWVWQWDGTCSGAGTPSQGTVCPASDSLWWAVCDGTSCAAPTGPPTLAPATHGLSFIRIDAADANSQALSRYVVVTGSCAAPSGAPSAASSPTPAAGSAVPVQQSCKYTLSAWPGGNGGSALVQADVSWALYGSQTGQLSWGQSTYIGTYAFQGGTLPMTAAPQAGGAEPTGVELRYSSDSGGSWRQTTLPLTISATAPVTLPGTRVQVYGHCSAPYYQCAYTAVVPMTAVAKPWLVNFHQSCGGTTVTGDCSGFTLGQFALLDLSKMDLSSWEKSLAATEPDTQKMAAKAAGQSKSIAASAPNALAPSGTQAQIQNGVPPAPAGQPAPLSGGSPSAPIVLNKTQCEADSIANTCDIELTAVGNWPDDSGCGQAATPANGAVGIFMGGGYCPRNVTSLAVSWGDGASSTLAGPAPGVPPVFQVSHRYASAGTYGIRVTFSLADGSTHTADARVQAWNGTPPPNQQNQAKYGGANPILP